MAWSARTLGALHRRPRLTVRMLGSSATLPMQARGVLAGNIFGDACPWDLSAGAFLCQQAGHLVSALDGGPWRIDGSGIVTAHDAATHAALLACAREDA